MKIAFIGDSYSAYEQDGQYKEHWSYKLAQQFPQHQYYNYALGGRGVDHHQWCILDAKKREIDVVFINRTFNHRVAQQYGDDDFSFSEKLISDNYSTMTAPNHAWFSGHANEYSPLHIIGNGGHHPIKDQLTASIQDRSISVQNQQYNDQWFDNVDQLYNFKHVIKLELLPIPESGSASHLLEKHADLSRVMFKTGAKKSEIFYNAGFTISLTDDHWSPTANTWVLENFILSQKTIDILNNS